MTRIVFAALAFACAFSMPAFAAEVATAGDTAVILPWGAWVVAIAETAKEVLIPLAITAATAFVGTLWSPLRLVITNAVIDRSVRLAGEYALNAVKGAAKGKTSSIEVSYPLVKTGLERLLGSTPGFVVGWMGGPQKVAERLFRWFDFDETVSDANTLSPLIAALPNLPFVDPLQVPPVPMTDR